MKLGLYNAARRHFAVMRGLSAEEIGENERYRPVIAEARNRLMLFRILDKNFREWRAYLNKLLSATFEEPEDASEELNRLLLNYLACAYGIREHFENSYQRQFRHDPARADGHEDFIAELCKSSWPFAFFWDFRDYVQHVGLAVGRYARRAKQASVSIEVVADAKHLTSESREWKRSKLEPTRGEIDLMSTLHEFHIQMLHSYGMYVAKTFHPKLASASEFYARLTQEAKSRDRFARMVFWKEEPRATREGGMTSVEGTVVYVPNDLFAELGIVVGGNASEESSPPAGTAISTN